MYTKKTQIRDFSFLDYNNKEVTFLKSFGISSTHSSRALLLAFFKAYCSKIIQFALDLGLNKISSIISKFKHIVSTWVATLDNKVCLRQGLYQSCPFKRILQLLDIPSLNHLKYFLFSESIKNKRKWISTWWNHSFNCKDFYEAFLCCNPIQVNILNGLLMEIHPPHLHWRHSLMQRVQTDLVVLWFVHKIGATCEIQIIERSLKSISRLILVVSYPYAQKADELQWSKHLTHDISIRFDCKV